MSLRRLELQVLLPPEVPVEQWRGRIFRALAPQGGLLRWAITAVTVDPSGSRLLQLEAVLQE